jgi:hypothetical protein
MQGGMQHAVAKGVTLQAKLDGVAHTITLREGPISLPANTSHIKMPQPPAPSLDDTPERLAAGV